MTALSTILSRRTIRFYKPLPVKEEDLRDMLNGARLTSCAANLQTLRYRVMTEPALAEKVFGTLAWAGYIRPKRTPTWGVNAPTAYIVVLAPDDNATHHADAGAAIQSMQIIAAEKGLGCCWLGAVDRKALANILSLNEKQQILYVVAVGVPDEAPTQVDISASDDIKYYLDANGRLTVPKIKLDDLATWN